MELLLKRLYLKSEYTIGQLFVDGVYLCDTLESRICNLSQEPKVAGDIAIPTGRYEIVIKYSPHFGCELPRLLGVPGFEGILIHRGKTPADAAGCILVGENRARGKVVNSTPYELLLTARLLIAQSEGTHNFITIIEA